MNANTQILKIITVGQAINLLGQCYDISGIANAVKYLEQRALRGSVFRTIASLNRYFFKLSLETPALSPWLNLLFLPSLFCFPLLLFNLSSYIRKQLDIF